MRFILFYILTATISQLYAQHIEGKVIDIHNKNNLNEVVVSNSDSSYYEVTRDFGKFIVPKPDTYTFSRVGYKTKTVHIDGEIFNIVEMSSKTENLNEVLILSNNFQSNLFSLPSAVSVVDSKVINQQDNINIAPVLNSISGIYMHNGTITTNRITIRGIGSRNLFGTAKIRAYYEDIPLTDGSGVSTIEDIDLNTLGRIEVLKGPSSSVYGSGLGGTIQLIPDKGLFTTNYISTSYSLGSFGLQKYLFQSDIGNSNNNAKITYSNLQREGYRKNNDTKRQSISVASNHFINNSNKLTFVGAFTDLKAYIPSSLNLDDYTNDPTSAAYTWGRSQGFENYKRALFGLSWNHNYTDKTLQKTSVFGSFLDSYEPRPFNILKERTLGIGVRTRVISKSTLFDKNIKWTFGGELFSDVNSYQTFQNLYNDFPVETGSVKGSLLSDFKEQRNYMNLFFDSTYNISSNLQLNFGFNINSTSYTLIDNFKLDNNDFSDDYSFNTVISPKLGLTQKLSNDTMFYVTISQGFSPPTLEETLLPNGSVNQSIKPETGWNYEIGSRGELFNHMLYYNIALYKMTVKDLLVARRTSDDQFIGINAGKTIYNGLELSINYRFLDSDTFKVYSANALTVNDFSFDTFIDDTDDYSGNDLTGVPNVTFNSTLNIDSIKGWYGILNFSHTGKIPIRDDNTLYSKSYDVMNLKIGYISNKSKKIVFDIYTGINNLFNEKYASMLLINASSFGGNSPRYYYPGEPVNFYSGIRLKYNLN